MWKPVGQALLGAFAIAGAAITTNNIAIAAATERTKMMRFMVYYSFFSRQPLVGYSYPRHYPQRATMSMGN